MAIGHGLRWALCGALVAVWRIGADPPTAPEVSPTAPAGSGLAGGSGGSLAPEKPAGDQTAQTRGSGGSGPPCGSPGGHD